MKRLRCFVAMAFGYDDTDKVYERIEKAFPKIEFRRVDRVNHNNDIDKQIIEELNAADVVISDLTYARPSAYWEAGYAQGRPIPVVYTSRSDHISTRQKTLVKGLMEGVPDKQHKTIERLLTDSHRVHFDLQMRNIIDWSKPTDALFIKRLRARINLVTAPLLKDRAKAEALIERRRTFAALSQHRQLQQIAQIAIAYFKKSGFKLVFAGDIQRDVVEQMGDRRKKLRRGVRFVGDTLQVFTISIYPTFSRQDLTFIRQTGSLGETTIAELNIAKRQPKQIEFVSVLLCLRKIGAKTLRDSFPSAAWDEKQTATLPQRTIFVPHQKLWKSGKKIRYELSSWKVGDDRVKTDARGTFVVTNAWRDEGKRIGDALECPFLRRYKVISGITDPSELPRLIDETFTPGAIDQK